ncbi:serine/threonine protein phosphatase, putative [Trypanosoma cruzi]|nr:serine/threonine protein phosphatase, putative [Trypanosoma cruzi]
MLVAVLRSGAGVAGEQLDGTVFCVQSRGDLAQLSYLQRDGRECWKHFRGTSFFSESAGPVVVLCEACAGRRALGGDRKEPCVFRLLFLARMLSGHVGPPLFFSFTSVFLTCFRPFSLLFPSLERSLPFFLCTPDKNRKKCLRKLSAFFGLVEGFLMKVFLCILLLSLGFIWVCGAGEVLPPEAYENRTLYPVIPTYDRLPLLSIGVLSDIQYADEEEKSRRHFHLSPGKVEHAVKEMNANRSHMDLVMHLGDTVNRDIARNLQVIDSLLKQLQFPFFQLLGNHDFLELGEEHRDHVYRLLRMPARYYSLQVGEGGAFLLIVLDGTDLSVFATRAGTARRAETNGMKHRYRHRKNMLDVNGGIGEEQMQWLRMQLEYASKQKMVVLVFCHFPMYPYDDELNLWNDVEVVRLLSNYSCVAAVISGHTHRWEHEQLVVAHKNGEFTIYFVKFGGIVQSPFTSWGFIEAYEKELHLHGLNFGRVFDYRLPIRGVPGGAVLRKTTRVLSSGPFIRRRRNVRVISRCGGDTKWLRNIIHQPVPNKTVGRTENVSSLMWVECVIFFSLVAVIALLRLMCRKNRRRQSKSVSVRSRGAVH